MTDGRQCHSSGRDDSSPHMSPSGTWTDIKTEPVSDVMLSSHIRLFLWQGRRGWPGSPGTPGSRRKMVRAL
jgi:hypothetical protein